MGPGARADIYTWTDAGGRVNISNLAPPEGARVTSVLHETPKPTRPQGETPPQPDVRMLAEREGYRFIEGLKGAPGGSN